MSCDSGPEIAQLQNQHGRLGELEFGDRETAHAQLVKAFECEGAEARGPSAKFPPTNCRRCAIAETGQSGVCLPGPNVGLAIVALGRQAMPLAWSGAHRHPEPQGSLTLVRHEIRRFAEARLEKTFVVGARSVMLPLSTSWTVFLLIGPAEAMLRRIEIFTSAQVMHDYV